MATVAYAHCVGHHEVRLDHVVGRVLSSLRQLRRHDTSPASCHCATRLRSWTELLTAILIDFNLLDFTYVNPDTGRLQTLK